LKLTGNIRSTDELIDWGLNMTKMIQDVLLDQYFSSRPISKDESRIRSSSSAGEENVKF